MFLYFPLDHPFLSFLFFLYVFPTLQTLLLLKKTDSVAHRCKQSNRCLMHFVSSNAISKRNFFGAVICEVIFLRIGGDKTLT